MLFRRVENLKPATGGKDTTIVCCRFLALHQLTVTGERDRSRYCWFLYCSSECDNFVSAVTSLAEKQHFGLAVFSWWSFQKVQENLIFLENLILKSKYRWQWFTRLSKISKPSGQLMSFCGLWDSWAFNRGAHEPACFVVFVIQLLFSDGKCCCLAGNWHSSLAGSWKMLFLLPPVGHHYVSSAFLGLFVPSLGWFYDPVPCWKKWAVLVLLSVIYWQMLQRPESENGHEQLNWHSQKSRQLLQRKNANLWNHISWSLCNNI